MASPQGTERYKKLQSHFQVLSNRAAKGKSLLPDTGYADFLKDLEHMALPNAVQRITPKPPHMDHKGVTGSGGSKLVPIVPPATIIKRAKASQNQSLQRLNAVESHLWKQRQEQRELRAAELNMKRQASHLQHSAHQFGKSMTKKQADATSQFMDRDQAISRSYHQELHQLKDDSLKKMKAAQTLRDKQNEVSTNSTRRDQELSWRYRGLLDALERKRTERDILGSEYLNKLRVKESEEQHLKKELRDVSVTMKMEAQKIGKTVDEIERQKIADIKAGVKSALSHEEMQRSLQKSRSQLGQKFERNKWAVQKDIDRNQERTTAKLRKGGHTVNDIRTRLQDNQHMKRLLGREVGDIEREMVGSKLTAKSQVVESRKKENVEEVRRKAMERNAKEYSEWEKKYFRNINEAMAREHGDRFNALKHSVNKYERMDADLLKKAREADTERKKKWKELTEMQDELSTLKKHNSVKIQNALMEADRAEAELHQKILRTDAAVRKTSNTKAVSLHQLTLHKLTIQEERRKMEDEKREQDRRIRIQSRDFYPPTS